MKKAAALSLLAAVMLFAAAVITAAQQQKKISRRGYLSNSFPSAESADSEVFIRRLRELGYVEGQNISIDYRYGEGRRDRASKLAEELTALNCDVIVVAGGYTWVRAVKEATKTIPIVMAGTGLDPVKAGLVKSLAHPGGNITGITVLTTELVGKQLEVFKEALPKLQRVSVLYESPSANPASVRAKKVFQDAARALKLTLQSWEVKTTDDFDKAFSAMGKQRPDGLFLLGGGGLIDANRKRIVTFALKSRLPSMLSKKDVECGGLMSYAADRAEHYRRIAYYVDRILKCAKPADLPVEQPTKFELVINLKTAEEIRVTIPPNVLARADRVIR